MRHATLTVAAGCAAALVVGGLVGLAAARTDLALPLAVVVLVVSLSLTDWRVLPVIAVPSTLLLTKVAGDVLSITDVVLAAAAAVALLAVHRDATAQLRAMLWSGAAYLACTVPTLILNPYTANLVEWGHEVILVLGAMITGFAVGRFGAAAAALWVYLLGTAAVAVAAVIVSVQGFAATGEFAVAYLPGNLHKNYIGGALAIGAIIALVHPKWMGGPAALARTIAVVNIGGLFAANSRQGMIALVVGVLVVVLRRRDIGWAWRVALVALGAAVIAWVNASVDDQAASENRSNSYFVRVDAFEWATGIWRESPWFGVGMRWWYTDRYDGFQPPNAELEVLSTTGIAGLIGFFVMFGGVLWVLLRLDPAYGTLGVAVVLARFTQAQFDIFWVAGSSSLLWMIAGICVGAAARADLADPPPQDRYPASMAATRSTPLAVRA